MTTNTYTQTSVPNTAPATSVSTLDHSGSSNTKLSKSEKLRAIWKKTHSDYKSVIEGARFILVFRNGTELVSLEELTEAEIESKHHFWDKHI